MIGTLIRNLAVLMLLGIIGGMLWYAGTIPAAPSGYEEPTDAIIVLTGGGERLNHGFALLTAGKGKEMLITGVGKGVKLTELLAQHSASTADTTLDAGAISLDYAAISTATNASAAHAWMHEKGFKTARLVTANYHMPRALLEFSAAMPEIIFYPDPVFPQQEFKLDAWYKHTPSFTMLVSEYAKFLFASLKYSSALPTPALHAVP